ncbi:MAG: hypothetical protein CVV41_22350 [Candidatus Riflebacteria bacterium HGW-Riflebacteria-1]|jgi:hypothetical protein|nr:MAG: hypothetical protein CVV41_22350 [Candidatus Riflebacteria bacterium HGW-Riflebacteria-1]
MPTLLYAIAVITLTGLKVIPSISAGGAALPLAIHSGLFAILLLITFRRRSRQVRYLTERIQPVIEKYSRQDGDMASLKEQLRPVEERLAEKLLTADGLTDLVMSSAFGAILDFFKPSESSGMIEMREQIHKTLTTIAETKQQFRMTLIWCLTISILAIIVNL